MKRLLGAVLATALLLLPSTALAARLTTTISIADEPGYFAVTRSFAYDRDTIWVTNKCFDADGNVVLKNDRAVQWGPWASLDGIAGPFPTAGVSCIAYTTLRPWQDRIGEAFVEYTP